MPEAPAAVVLPGSTNRLVAAPEDRDLEEWDDPIRGHLAFRTLFSGDTTPTRELTTGLAVIGVGGWLGLHRHSAAETYFVHEGTGVVTLEGRDHSVGPGCAVLIPGDAEHGISNTGDVELKVFYAFAAHAMSDVRYRFRRAR